MIAQIAKVGNSQGIRITKDLLKSLGLRVGDTVELFKKDGEIILKPTHGVNWLLEDYERPEDGETWENYDEAKGREVW